MKKTLQEQWDEIKSQISQTDLDTQFAIDKVQEALEDSYIKEAVTKAIEEIEGFEGIVKVNCQGYSSDGYVFKVYFNQDLLK